METFALILKLEDVVIIYLPGSNIIVVNYYYLSEAAFNAEIFGKPYVRLRFVLTKLNNISNIDDHMDNLSYRFCHEQFIKWYKIIVVKENFCYILQISIRQVSAIALRLQSCACMMTALRQRPTEKDDQDETKCVSNNIEDESLNSDKQTNYSPKTRKREVRQELYSKYAEDQIRSMLFRDGLGNRWQTANYDNRWHQNVSQNVVSGRRSETVSEIGQYKNTRFNQQVYKSSRSKNENSVSFYVLVYFLDLDEVQFSVNSILSIFLFLCKFVIFENLHVLNHNFIKGEELLYIAHP